MAKNNEYLDDSIAKKSMRTRVLRRAKQLFAVTGQPNGVAISLAGPSAGDLSGLKYVLGYSSKDIVLVDRDPTGLYAALERDDKVNVYEGDIDDAINEMLYAKGKASFINLDFCGRFSSKVKSSCVLASKILEDKGLLFLTFFRGRESADEKKAIEMTATGHTDPEWARFSFISAELRTAMGLQFERVFAGLYSSHGEGLRHSPMGVIGFQKMPYKLQTSTWRSIAWNQGDIVKDRVKSKKDADVDLKTQVIALMHEGKKSKEIGAILNVPPSRVAAWLANHTRGR